MLENKQGFLLFFDWQFTIHLLSAINIDSLHFLVVLFFSILINIYSETIQYYLFSFLQTLIRNVSIFVFFLTLEKKFHFIRESSTIKMMIKSKLDLILNCLRILCVLVTYLALVKADCLLEYPDDIEKAPLYTKYFGIYSLVLPYTRHNIQLKDGEIINAKCRTMFE